MARARVCDAQAFQSKLKLCGVCVCVCVEGFILSGRGCGGAHALPWSGEARRRARAHVWSKMLHPNPRALTTHSHLNRTESESCPSKIQYDCTGWQHAYGHAVGSGPRPRWGSGLHTALGATILCKEGDPVERIDWLNVK